MGMSRHKAPNRAASQRQKPTTPPAAGVRVGIEPLSYADLPVRDSPVREAVVVAKSARGNNRVAALGLLATTAQLERSVAHRRDRQVRAARKAGATWTDISRVLGVSPQAVQQRYGKPVSGE